MKSLPFILLTLFIAGCSGRPNPIPRPEAYPRVELYPESYRNVDIRQLTVLVNDSATVDTLSPQWFNIQYTAYGMTVNITLSDYSPEVMDNRMERIERNLGGSSAEVAQLPSGIVVVAPAAMHTPVHILATDSSTWILSGVAVSNFPAGTSTDSVAPLIDAVATDMTVLVKNL